MRASRAPNARVFARDSLQIAVPKGNPAHVANLKDLAAPGVTVALCAETAPCGTGAGIALADAGVTVTPASRERDAAAALDKVRLGKADAALVYRTDVRAAGERWRAWTSPRRRRRPSTTWSRPSPAPRTSP